MVDVLLVGCRLERSPSGGRLEVAEYLADFLLLDLLPPGVSGGVIVAAAGGGEDHVFDEFVDALAVSVVEDLADDALQEGLVLELGLFLLLALTFFLALVMLRERVVVGVFLLRLGADEAVEVGLRRIEFKRRVVLFQQLVHAPQYYTLNKLI